VIEPFNYSGTVSRCIRSILVLTAILFWHAHAQAQTIKFEVDILGLDKELRNNALATVSIARSRSNKRLPASEIERLHRLAPLEIEAALQPFGYYEPTVRADLERGTGTWKARYEVDPGRPISLHRIAVQIRGEGAADSVLLALVADFPMGVGDQLLHAQYDSGKRALADRAAERGYLDAAFDTSEVRIDRAAYEAEIVLHLNTGQRFLFGPITVHQDIVDTLLIVGHIPFQPGDTVDLKKLRRLQENLTEAPYFGRAEVDLQRDKAEGRAVPVDVTLTARKRQRFEIGAGYGTDTGVRGRLEGRLRRLNRKGHNATIRLDASSIERTLTAQYQIPPAFPRTATWAVVVGGGDFSPNWSNSNQLFLRLNRSQSVFGGRGLVGLGIEGSDFEIASVRDSSLLLLLNSDWLRLRTDNVMFPKRGFSTRLRARGSHEDLLSTVSFAQVQVDAKVAYGFAPFTRFLVRGEAGYTWTNNFDGLPPDNRYVTGGARTVRGYDFETLGPRNDAGQLLGGPALLVGSVELDFMPIKKWGKWGIAAFIDAGNALESFREVNLEVGAGFGLRWLSPIGTLRLDYGQSLSRRDRSPIIHFNMGPYL
jgi:translocation and assembly module TamA